MFEGKRDWRAYLVYPPDYYEEKRITVRRKCRVTQVDPRRRVLMLAHREEVGYDTLLIASGGGGYLPPRLAEYAPLFHHFGTYRAALATADALPDGGTRRSCSAATSSGIDVAHAIAATGHRVILIASEQVFWPHKVERGRLSAPVRGARAGGHRGDRERRDRADRRQHERRLRRGA